MHCSIGGHFGYWLLDVTIKALDPLCYFVTFVLIKMSKAHYKEKKKNEKKKKK